MMNILVAYASAHGSTAQVALAIGQQLTERGLNVTVSNVKDVRTIRDYDAIVSGSAIHNGALLKEMTAFFRAFSQELSSKSLYLWLNCIRVMEQYGKQHVLDYYLDHEVLGPLHIRDTAIFAGKLDLQSVDWNERWTLSARYDGSTWPSSFEGDFRDWEAIHAWGVKIALQLTEAKPSVQTG
jgi:menaquinone-dependent protoporphyrinogen oxidase